MITGPLSQRYGWVHMIRLSLVATAILGAACTLPPIWPVLLIVRAAQGLALAGVPAVAMVYLREEVHPSVHPRATGICVGGNAIGGMAGRFFAGGFTQLGGWRCGLGAVSLLGALCTLAVLVWPPPSRHHRRVGPVVTARRSSLPARVEALRHQCASRQAPRPIFSRATSRPNLVVPTRRL